jgi:glycosyltransferase involved in cell wall biosynthesis
VPAGPEVDKTGANAAICFDPESYAVTGAKLMGRHAAGEGFLRGFVRHAGVRPLYGYCETRAGAEAFARQCREHGAEEGEARWIAPHRLAAVAEAGTLYVPGPNLAEMAWRRERLGARAYSLCGVTHTISSHRAMDSLAECQSAPLQPWDGLICTSRPVQDSVRRLWEANGQYLRARFEARTVPSPTTALIPLGVDCEFFAPDPAQAQRQRERMGIGAQDIVFLFMGRLSFHAKANPLPMFAALEQAAAQMPGRLHLILAGWFPNDAIERRFRESAREICPAVNTLYLDGRKPEVRRGVWHAADVFISLPDNIQETFGLTPIEAMAAGLPSVVSDWDGYRDTVRDGVDGFRIPTLMPAPPAGEELAARHEDGRDTYDRYIGYASQFIAVDTAACAAACVRLAGDAALRRQMGAAARARARAEFDWSVIIRRYQDFWRELAQLRAAAPAPQVRPDPRRLDPFLLFAGYASAVLDDDCRFGLAPGASLARLRALAASPLAEFGKPVHPAEELCGRILERLADGPCSLAALANALAPPAGAPVEPVALHRAVVWLHKLGLIDVRARKDSGRIR